MAHNQVRLFFSNFAHLALEMITYPFQIVIYWNSLWLDPSSSLPNECASGTGMDWGSSWLPSYRVRLKQLGHRLFSLCWQVQVLVTRTGFPPVPSLCPTKAKPNCGEKDSHNLHPPSLFIRVRAEG